ncbi:hypothetical protein ES332_D05G148600v1 [Gossypium tomentosum]|uniref:Uncharacterized protein n=1 Tax=Gossypium tomentosum TaxID=34277 RepID=A0A5D2KVK5_GOSTO|nr:hypothetical protein ES332_D05G148600v1 [Gossypium tomentosum]
MTWKVGLPPKFFSFSWKFGLKALPTKSRMFRQGNSGKADVGAIICDHHGGWLIGSFHHIPKAMSVEVEL